MDENVLTALALDEAEALAGIEPLHCTLFFTHCFTLFRQPKPAEHNIKLSDAQGPEPLNRATAVFKLCPGSLQSSAPNKKMAASVTLRPLYYPKAIQEQQTQRQSTTVWLVMQAVFRVVN